MNSEGLHIVFLLDGRQYAMPVSSVERVIPAVEITKLPETPEVIMGIIMLYGETVPVLDIRKKLELPGKKTELSDFMIVAALKSRRITFLADSIDTITDFSGTSMASADDTVPCARFIEGIVSLSDGLVLITDLEKVLTRGEGEAVTRFLVSREVQV